ncbi:MAG: ATP/GTP-binding protein [Candidatus Asgardarchaeia archaeon]
MFVFENTRKYAIVIAGPAGSGKSTLTKAFEKWLNNAGYTVKTINLDPGAEYVPYIPTWDIRDKFTVSEIMKRKKLGPNGAMLEAMKEISENIDDLLNEILKIDAEFILIDTPGQIEIFAFRDVGQIFVSKLNKKVTTLGVFLIDGLFIKNIVSFIVANLLATSVELNLGIPFVSIINKADLLDSRILNKLKDTDFLKETLLKEGKGAIMDLALPIAEAVINVRMPARNIIVSATKEVGLEDLFDMLHELFCTCGDLT